MADLPLLDLIDGRADLQPIAPVLFSRRDTNEDRFLAFHAANPHVYRLIVKISRHLKDKGAKQFGIKAVFERLRWLYFETRGEAYKLNNTHTRYYARLVMQQEPDLAGFYEIRNSPHDSEYYAKSA